MVISAGVGVRMFEAKEGAGWSGREVVGGGGWLSEPAVQGVIILQVGRRVRFVQAAHRKLPGREAGIGHAQQLLYSGLDLP